MKTTSKTWVLSLVLWIGLLAPANAATPVKAATPVNAKILHVLNRLSFGARPGDIQKVEAMGVDRYIQQQLNPESMPEPQALTNQLAQLETLRLNPIQLVQEFRPQLALGQKKDPAQQKTNRQFGRTATQEAVEARLLRATESDRQLQEVMVDFWFNHFNVYSGKGLTRVWVGSYEQEAIRPYAFGRFRDLLEATARHPAMLFYLDNWQNTAPNSAAAKGRFQGLNENYARELMELHTLGVDSGYTQQDVISLAKILTGWGFRRVGQAANGSNAFYFDTKRHDFSDKVFLGRTIKGSGIQEVEQALDMLAKHPATARHLSYQLAQYFVADQPPKALIDRLTQKYQATDGNIREVLRTLFRSPEFMDSKYYNAKFKTPYQYVVSAFRAAGTDVANPQFVQTTLQQLGMPIYGCQTPDGYKNTQDAWLNPDAMTRRLSFATVLASGRVPVATASAKPGMPVEVAGIGAGARNQEPATGLNSSLQTSVLPVDFSQLTATLGDRFSPQTHQAIAASPPPLRSALVLGSPEFMRR